MDNYQDQLNAKAEALRNRFAPFAPPELEVFASPSEHYRMRAEFRIWHEGEDLYHVMFDQESRERVRIDQFPVACTLINRVMVRLVELLKPNPVLRKRLFQIDYLATTSEQILVSLLYHRNLDNEWQQAAQALKAALVAEGFDLHIIGRAHKQKIVIDQDFVVESLNVDGQTLHYKQIENSFTQPNAVICTKMLEWARSVTAQSSGDLLELYCGNGNFSIALAPNFRQVLATEIAKPSVDAAQYNIAVNGVENLTILRMSAEEFTMAVRGQRSFRRLEEAKIDLTQFNCETILVDPPRAGLDSATCTMVQDYQRILYISCNPETLSRDLEQLTQTHRIARFALFDQFPWTHHMESGVWLERRDC